MGNGKNQFRGLLRRAEPVRRNLVPKGIPGFRIQCGVHVGVDEAAGNGIDLNIAGGQLFCQCFGKGIDPAL